MASLCSGLLLALIVVSTGDYWEATFASHPDNVALIAVTECSGEKPYHAYVKADIDDTTTRARVRRVYPPYTGCTVTVMVLRNSSGKPGEDSESIGESTTINSD
jgi:hypothetical protein